MAALVAALLTQASDRAPWTAAALGDRYASKGAVIAAAALALTLGNALGVVGGVLVKPLLSPNARDLLLAMALLSAGVTAFWPTKPATPRDYRLGPFGTSLIVLATLGFGDRLQFITGALAARSDVPLLAAIGATLGALAVHIPAILLGESGLRPGLGRVPTTMIRLIAASLLSVAGLAQGLGALRLI